ncbi:hypothetical protein niasHS_017116 [Heterodera schachtii]|uniref:Uncharacterized protein n=1 Tax=Heterodera schachtii TaxID=97005 RepID=A0ABD2HZ29_HETSC
MAENEQNVPPVQQQEQAPALGNGNENGALQQGQMRGQFRAGWRGRVKNRGTVRGGGRPWNGTAAFCHCVECRRPKGWHGRVEDVEAQDPADLDMVVAVDVAASATDSTCIVEERRQRIAGTILGGREECGIRHS